MQCEIENYVNREEWVAARRTFLGASEAAAILGVGYAGQSPLSVWASKVRGFEIEFSEDARHRMRIGQLLESGILAAFSERTGLPAELTGEFAVYRHQEREWLATTLDGVATVDGHQVPVEIKTVDQRHRADWEGMGPLKFQIQVQHQLAVTGAPFGFLVGLVGLDLIIIPIAADAEFQAKYLRIADRFWAMVEASEQPSISDEFAAAEADAEALKHLYPHDDGSTIELADDFLAIDEELAALKRTRKDVDTRVKELENQVKEALGDATFGLLPHNGGRYSWKQVRKVMPAKESYILEYRTLRRLK